MADRLLDLRSLAAWVIGQVDPVARWAGVGALVALVVWIDD